MSALDYMMQCYPEEKEVEQMRKSLGLYALTGKQQVDEKQTRTITPYTSHDRGLSHDSHVRYHD